MVDSTDTDVLHVEEKCLDSLPIISKELKNAIRVDLVLSRVL